ncbi:unnamed protein product [Phytophthora lilii]|uniref:Unnamed protein product n=1 Tax=Phytophthora lilii TaxID=2077276 RepID=A0A9W6X6G0_9STRA|nr:unnamed protein product [Phytophthora lilii]
MLGMVAPSLSGGGPTVERTQPQRDTNTSTVSVVTTRAQAARRPDTAVRTNNIERASTRTVDATEATPQAGPVPSRTRQLNKPYSSDALDFVQCRQAVIRFVQDAIAASANRQKLNADNANRGNTNESKRGSLVLLATQNLPRHAVSDFGASKLAPRSIGPFTVQARHGNAYTLDIPSGMRLHPTFYVGRLKPYVQHESPKAGDSQPRTRRRASRASPDLDLLRSRSSAKPQQAEPYTTKAPASAARTETPGAARKLPAEPQDHSQQAAD